MEAASEMIPGDINEGLRITIAMMRRTNPPGITIEEEFGDLPMVRCQPGQINQVFFNLFQNAADAIGGQAKIRVTTRRTNAGVEVRVKDTGPGVPTEIVHRLFEPFFTTKAIGKGAGLGLAVSAQIAKTHHGSIEFDPSSTPGACFILTLPVDSP
jgi:signal transduction histidine kinase